MHIYLCACGKLFLCVHSCHFSSGSLIHNQNILFLRSPLGRWHMKGCTAVPKHKLCQIFSPNWNLPFSLLWHTIAFAFSSSAIKKERNIAAFCERLTDVRVWFEMIVYNRTSHLEEPCRQSLFAPLFLTQKLHTAKESYLSLTRMSEP